MKKLLRNKQGQVGLDTVKAVILAVLVLGTLAVVIILTVLSMSNVADTVDRYSLKVNNETQTFNETGNDTAAAGYRAPYTLTNVLITNASSVQVVHVNNYTVVGQTIKAVSASTNTYLGKKVNVTYSFTYAGNNSYDISSNVTKGLDDFFGNIPTIFAILVVVVIIASIAIVIGVVQRFGGSGGI